MNLTSNEQLQEVIKELKSHNLPYKIEEGGKHIAVRFEVNGVKCVSNISRGRNTNWRALVMKRADIRRAVRTYGQQPTETVTGEVDMSKLKVITEDNLEVIRGEPRMRDTDIAEALGFSRSQNVRNLITSHERELRSYGALALSERGTTDRGGRPTKVFLLNKDQALLIAMVSRAPGSAAVRQQVIKAYNDWNTHHPKEIQTMPETSTAVATVADGADPELLINKDAVAAITEAVAARIAIPTGGITKSDLQEMLAGILEFQNRKFETILSRTAPQAQIAARPSDELTLRLTETMVGFQSTMQSIDARLNALSSTAGKEPAQINPTDKGEIIKDVPKPDPQVEDEEEDDKTAPVGEDELVDMGGLYKMIGIRPNRLPNRMSISQKIRNSLHVAASRKGISLSTQPDKYGSPSVMYPKSLVENWYDAKGRTMIRKAIVKQTSGLLA